MDPIASKDIMRRDAGALKRFLIGAWTFSRRLSIGIGILLVLLIAARIALPFVLRSAINERLNQIPGYAGHIEKIHVALWRGAYELRGIKIIKKQGSKTEPYFSAQAVEFSLAWRELIRGKFVSDITIEEGRINFIKAATAAASQLEVDRRWQDVIKDIFPVDLTYLKVVDGRIHYTDQTANPVFEAYIEHMQGLATGLRNRSEKNDGEFPAHMNLKGDTIGGGVISAAADAEPLADHPHFEMRLKLENVSLPELNSILRSRGGVDVSAGTFKFYMEMAARGGRFEGYVKPFFSNVKFTDITDGDKPISQRAWQAVASGLVAVLKNKSRDELATRIPFSGEFGHTDVGVWPTITSMLHNGFIHPLTPAIEHSVKSDAIPPPKTPPAL
jgi:hypothetical protein